MVKILYVISTLKRTGPTNVLYNLISELDKTKFEPLVLTLSVEDERFPSLYEDFKKLNISINSLNLTRLSGFLSGKSMLKRFVDKHQINIVHLNGFRGDILVKAADYSKLQAIVSTINSNIYDDYTMLYGKLKGSIMAWLHMRSLKDKIAIGCSNFVVKELNKKYNSQLTAIYNGIPKCSYTVPTIDEKNQLKKELGLNIDEKIFVFVGYLIYRKDPLTAIKGFLNAKIDSNTTFLVIGDGPLMDECKSLLITDENKSVRFLGNQSQTLKYLKASDYYIASSYSEGLPTSVMEAMACGLPIILSNIQPHIELTQAITSWNYLFNLNDSTSLSNKIEQILKDDYNKLSNQCRAIIDEKINSTVMARKYEEVYINGVIK